MKFKFIVTILLYSISYNCFGGGEELLILPSNPPEKVLEKVEDFIVANNILINDFKLTGATYDYLTQKWSFYYRGNAIALSNYFTVIISDTNLGDIGLEGGL